MGRRTPDAHNLYQPRNDWNQWTERKRQLKKQAAMVEQTEIGMVGISLLTILMQQLGELNGQFLNRPIEVLALAVVALVDGGVLATSVLTDIKLAKHQQHQQNQSRAKK